MGVTHSMEEGQVKRISKALNGSAKAIQGINTKFDLIDEHVHKMMEFNRATNSKVNNVLSSFERLDDTFNDRAEMLLESLVGATNSLTEVLEAAVVSLDKVNIRKELDNIPKAMITLAIPFVILVIELAVSNAYLGILLASLPSVSLRYSNYLIAYASTTLLGLFLSLLWLVCYRVWLSTSCKGKFAQEEKTEETLQRLSRLRTRSQSFGESLIVPDSPFEEPKEGRAADGSSSAELTRSKPVDSISWAKARRLERKKERNITQGDDGLSHSESEQASPMTSPAHPPAIPVNLPPLQQLIPLAAVFESPSQDADGESRPGIPGGSETSDAIQRAEKLAAEAAANAREDYLVEPVPDESRGFQEAERPPAGQGRKGMVQMRWNSWDNPFKMDMTWGGRKTNTSVAPPASSLSTSPEDLMLSAPEGTGRTLTRDGGRPEAMQKRNQGGLS